MQQLEGNRSRLDYLRVKEEAEKPLHDRGKVIKTNRKTTTIPRRYHLSQEKLEAFKHQDGIPNPYRSRGCYHSIIQALIELGVNEKHEFLVFKAKLQEIMSGWKNKHGQTGWEAFVNKKPRNKLCACDSNGRIINNANVLQRLTGFNPYGEKLRQLGMCIDIFKGQHNLPAFRLRTGIEGYENVLPINEFKITKKKN